MAGRVTVPVGALPGGSLQGCQEVAEGLVLRLHSGCAAQGLRKPHGRGQGCRHNGRPHLAHFHELPLWPRLGSRIRRPKYRLWCHLAADGISSCTSTGPHLPLYTSGLLGISMHLLLLCDSLRLTQASSSMAGSTCGHKCMSARISCDMIKHCGRGNNTSRQVGDMAYMHGFTTARMRRTSVNACFA